MRGSAGVTAPIIAMLLLCVPAAGWARNAEIVKELGPAAGEWQINYVGQFGDASGARERRGHSGQSFYGVSDFLAVGGETMLAYRERPGSRAGRVFFDYDSVAAILRLRDPARGVLGIGMWLQAGLDEDGEVARLETRLMVEQRRGPWHAQANAVLRRSNEERAEGTYLAYSGQVSHAVGPTMWLGIEGSGQAARLSGFRRFTLDRDHYLGPKLAFDFDLVGRIRPNLSLRYLRRISEGGGGRDTIQLGAEIRF